jgi:ATP-dependent helicase HrpB
VIDAELIVAVDVAETGARGQASRVQIRRASAIDASWLLDLYLDRVEERDELVWNAQKERVERVAQMTYDGLVIDETRDVDGARRAACQAAREQAIAAARSSWTPGVRAVTASPSPRRSHRRSPRPTMPRSRRSLQTRARA